MQKQTQMDCETIQARTKESGPRRFTSSTESQLELKRLLDYDPITGDFIWKVALSAKIRVGDFAGSIDSKGYIKICIGGIRYGAHALAWLYIYGELTMVDHEDNIPSNNAIGNLRKASYSQNNHRRLMYNPLGHIGVRYRSGAYEAHIRIEGIITRIGKYDTVEEAAIAYKEAAKKHFGDFANG